MRDRPPRLGHAVLRFVLPRITRDAVLADLEALWVRRCAEEGRRAADRWYWAQVLSAAGPSLAHRWKGRSVEGFQQRAGGGGTSVDSVKQDVAFALKQLRRRPGVGIIVATTLALGIGATTSIFSAVHGVLLRPLPFEDPHELVMITSEAGGSSDVRYLAGPDVVDLVVEVEGVEDAIVFGETTLGPLTQVEHPEHVKVGRASWNVFDVLGVEAALGRTFSREDGLPVEQGDTLPPPGAAVISHGLWQRSFGGDPGVIGKVVRVWGGSAEIIGVLPAETRIFTPPELNLGADVEIWRVFRWDFRDSTREGRYYRVVARLADGASVASARSEVDAFTARLRARHPHHAQEATRLRVASVEEAVAKPVRGLLVTLMGAVTLVLLIACGNVANLLLARGTSRAGEMAVRSSLGAERGRLIRQLLTESAVLAFLGALLGCALAATGVHLLHQIHPPDLPRLAEVRLDVPVLVFTVAVAIAATLLSGLLPALQAAGQRIAGRLSQRGGTGAGRRSRTALVVAQVALSVTLLAGTGLLIRTFMELERLPLGFEPDRVLTVTATQTGRPREERQAFEVELARAVEAVPGVSASGIVFPLPMNGVYERSAEYAMTGRETDPQAWTVAYFRTMSPTYFDAMGLELRRGRGFTSADEVYEAPVVILDERLARREFGSADPVGRRLWIRGMGDDTLNAEIVGVVEYAPQWDHRDDRPTMYLPRVLYQSHEVSVVARVEGDPAQVAPGLMAAIRGVDPRFPSDLVPMRTFVRERLAGSRFLLVLMEVFAGVALLLSAVGLYGVLSYMVRQQTRELGVRLAFGAVAADLTKAVVWDGTRLAAGGIGIGLIGALLMGRRLEAQLFQVGSLDPWALGGTAGAVLVTAVLSSLLPALRASRVDPVQALSEE